MARPAPFIITVVAAFTSVAHGEPPTTVHPWRLVEDRHWTIESPSQEDIAATDVAEATTGSCQPGMVEVAGRMKRPASLSIEALQDQACTSWIGRAFPARCAAFDRSSWLDSSRGLPTTPMHFCVDRFEYPNRRGAYPLIFVTWTEAGDLCARDGKRLCSEDEWTFACEGEEGLPYPYGYERDDTACVIDRPHRIVDETRLSPRNGAAIEAELDRLWQGEPSGSRPRCRSPYGVYDLTGNVDEWTRSTQASGYRSILKGGYWGPIRARCRPSTRAHGEEFAYYQQGFRCCADAL